MKKTALLASILAIFASAPAQNIALEKWTYSTLSFRPLGNAKSLTGTGSAFGNTTDLYLSDYLGYNGTTNGVALIANFAGPPPSYLQSVSAPSYAGTNSGAYRISFDIVEAIFPNTGTGKGQFGWGLRSNASGTDDCTVLFRYDNGDFQLVPIDATGTRTPVTIATGTTLADLSVSMQFNLDAKGTAGSFSAFYQIGGGLPVPIYPQQMVLHNDFQIDGFTLQFDMTSAGFSWAANDYAYFDNLLFETISTDITLTNISHGVSFIQKNGIFTNTPTYEPGDVLKIVTTNLNDSIIAANDVTTTLWADPTAFTITALSSNAYPSVAPNETYTGEFQVTILDGATNGPSTFTVTNRINSASPAPIAFESSF